MYRKVSKNEEEDAAMPPGDKQCACTESDFDFQYVGCTNSTTSKIAKKPTMMSKSGGSSTKVGPSSSDKNLEDNNVYHMTRHEHDEKR